MTALSQIGSERSVPIIIDSIGYREPNQRSHAFKVLAKWPKADVYSTLANYAKSREISTAVAALKAIGESERLSTRYANEFREKFKYVPSDARPSAFEALKAADTASLPLALPHRTREPREAVLIRFALADEKP
ncbi:MAG: hypothetical protein U5N86_04125 [Planctomycetota bacterium]|nr:hypothetical protein [Planctomycetota bacterium]